MNELERELFALFSAEEYGTKIRKAGVYLFPSDYRFDPHAHLEYEINYINTGHCIMSVGEDYVPGGVYRGGPRDAPWLHGGRTEALPDHPAGAGHTQSETNRWDTGVPRHGGAFPPSAGL